MYGVAEFKKLCEQSIFIKTRLFVYDRISLSTKKKKSSQVFFTIFDVSFLPHFLTTASFTFSIKIKVFCNNKKKHIQAII